MASVPIKHIILEDGWPGIPNFNLGEPANGFDSTVSGSGNCVSTALYPLGTKIARHYKSSDQTNWPGQSIFCYMRYYEGTDLAYTCMSSDLSDGYNMCFHAEITTSTDGEYAGPYTVTNDLTNSDGTHGGPVAIACVDMSSDECGWFWVGGVCPISDVTQFDGEVTTGGAVAKGSFLFVEDEGSDVGIFEQFDVTAITDTTGWPDISAAVSAGQPVGRALYPDA